ncbi:MAG TPA: immunoglobulin domain-containing protein [Methylomirabilota bacterium]|nr:immunoglobulin domain-containing protein [Methylomirabilota bacterium]
MCPLGHKGGVSFSAKRLLACFLVGCGTVLAALGQAPPNDEFTNATLLSGNLAIFSGTLSNATYADNEPGDPCGSFFSLPTVWWSWTASESSAVVVETLEHSPTTMTAFAVFMGDDVSTLSALDCNFMDAVTNRYLSFLATSGTTYYLRVLGDAASFTMRLRATNPPVVLAQPQSTTLAAGSSAWFGVVAGGMAPLHYQWRFGGAELPGQTAPILLLETPAATQAGPYSVILSNVSGVATSAVANLAFSPADPRPTLTALRTEDPTRFSFALGGVSGRRYVIEGSTNLVDWSGEPEFFTCCEGNPGVVLATNGSSVFSVSRSSDRRFLRASPLVQPEICVSHLHAIDFAIKLFTIHMRKDPLAPVAQLDLADYLKDWPVCPSGGSTFADSYSLTAVDSPPACIRFPTSHVQSP